MIRLLSLAALALILNGCLVTVESDTDAVETVWSDSDVSRLELGSSDEQWVRSSFGEPASKLSYADGSQVWKYRNISERDFELGVFLVFSIDVEEERVETLSIEFREGVVTNYWIEQDS